MSFWKWTTKVLVKLSKRAERAQSISQRKSPTVSPPKKPSNPNMWKFMWCYCCDFGRYCFGCPFSLATRVPQHYSRNARRPQMVIVSLYLFWFSEMLACFLALEWKSWSESNRYTPHTEDCNRTPTWSLPEKRHATGIALQKKKNARKIKKNATKTTNVHFPRRKVWWFWL